VKHPILIDFRAAVIDTKCHAVTLGHIYYEPIIICVFQVTFEQGCAIVPRCAKQRRVVGKQKDAYFETRKENWRGQ
jgi:hypothetical protein